MLFDVYPLRASGQKLSIEEVRARVRRGHLELLQRDDGAPVRIATLRSMRGAILDELNCAEVTKITDHGLLVAGWERGTHARQTWWCVAAPASEAE